MTGGQIQPREQDFIVDSRSICMSIPATYTRHPFKIMEIYEDRANRDLGKYAEPSERSAD